MGEGGGGGVQPRASVSPHPLLFPHRCWLGTPLHTEILGGSSECTPTPPSPPPIQWGWQNPLTAAPPPPPRPPLQPPPVVRVLYEFQGRNSQELSVRMGDTLQVQHVGGMGTPLHIPAAALCPPPPYAPPPKGAGPAEEVVVGAEPEGGGGLRPQQHPGARGARGRQPGLPPLPPPHITAQGGFGGGGSTSSPPYNPPPQGSPPSLHMGSSPAEVTAWLKDKGFAPLCVAP